MAKPPRWFRPALLVLGALAVFWRLVEPVGGKLTSDDEVGYLALAANLAGGRGFSEYSADHCPAFETERTAWRPPLYPAFLALFFALDDDQPRAIARARTAQALLGGLAVLLLGWLAWLLHANPAAALLAAAFVARDGWSIEAAHLLITEPLFLLLLPAALLALLWPGGAKPAWRALAAGVLFGAAFLTRTVLHVFLPLLCLALLIRARRSPEANWRGRHALLCLAATLLVLLPWVVRNSLVNHRLTGLTTSAGFNLYVDNAPESHLRVWTALHDWSAGEAAAWTETERNADYLRRARRTIGENPGAFIRRATGRLWNMLAAPWLLSVAALAGLALALALQLWPNLVIALLLFNFAVIYGATFYDQRLALTVTPFKYLYAAFFLVWVVSAGVRCLRRRRIKSGSLGSRPGRPALPVSAAPQV